MKKAGSIQDLGYFVILIFALGVLFISFSAGWTQVVDIARNTTGINQSVDAMNVLQKSKDLQSRLDYVVFGTFIGFFLAIIITSWFVAGSAIFAFIYFLALLVFIVVALVFSYVWNTNIITVPALASALTYLPITDFLLQNLGLITTVVGFIGLIVLFSKPYITGER